jgi:hypothetical protein
MNTKLVDVQIKKECLSGQITSNIKRRWFQGKFTRD